MSDDINTCTLDEREAVAKIVAHAQEHGYSLYTTEGYVFQLLAALCPTCKGRKMVIPRGDDMPTACPDCQDGEARVRGRSLARHSDGRLVPCQTCRTPDGCRAADECAQSAERLTMARGSRPMSDGNHECFGCGRLIAPHFKDLRGQSVRSVHRDDVVVITGAEYLRKSRLASEAEPAATSGEPTYAKLAPADLTAGMEIEVYLIASNEGWEWCHGTVVGVDEDGFRVRWPEGGEREFPSSRKPPMMRAEVPSGGKR